MNLSIADLTTFVLVVRAGTITEAGRRLGLSTASISKRMTRLEDELGIRVLNRSSRAMSLTEEGKELYHRLVVILDDLDDSLSLAAKSGDNAKGVLRLISTSGLGRSRIAPLVAEFTMENPDLAVQLHLADKHIDLIRDGYDIAITVGQPADSTLIAKRLLRNRCYICASPKYLKKAPPLRTPGDLKRHHCLVLDCYGSYRDLWPINGPNHREMVRVSGNLVTDSSETLRDWLMDGLGIALKSEWDIQDELRTGSLVTLLEGYTVPNLDFYIVYASRKHLPAKTKEFVEFLERYTDRIAATSVAPGAPDDD